MEDLELEEIEESEEIEDSLPKKKTLDINDLWSEYVDELEELEESTPQRRKRGKPKKGSTYVVRFTNEETKEIIENTVRFNKNDKRIYQLVLIWLTSFYKHAHFKILRNLSGGSIFVHDFDKNTEEIKTIAHDLIVALCKTGINKKGKLTGLKHKLDWNLRENQIISFVYKFVQFSLYQGMSRIYRHSKASNNLFNERNKPRMQLINKIASSMSDPSLTAVESIEAIKRHGISDAELYTYRHLFAMGDYDNFCSLNDDLLNKIEGNDNIIEQIEDQKKENQNKEIYDVVTEVINSTEIDKENRDFLKSYYQIPTVIENSITGEKFEFIQDLGDFMKYHPSFIREFCNLDEKANLPKNPLKKINMERVQNSQIFATAHEKIKEVLTTKLKKLNLSSSD